MISAEPRTRPPAGRDRIAAYEIVIWALALVAAAILRLLHLERQMLAADELHMVERAAAAPVREILTTFPTNDPCPPLAALTRWATDRGWVLGESELRFLPLAAGLLLVALVPLALRRRLGTPAALGLAWLLALSPSLVIYSRIVRPYSLVACLGIASLLLLDRSWRAPSWGWAALFALVAALATWLHPIVLPFTVAPLVAAFAGRLLRARWAPRWREILVPAAALAILLVAAYLPAFMNLARSVAHRTGQGRAFHVSMLPTTELLLGSRKPAAVAIATVLALVGLARLARARSGLARISATAVLGQIVVCLAVAPAGVANPVVLARYLLITVPVILLWVAVAITGARSGDSSAMRRSSLVVLAAAMLFVAGPLPPPGLLDSPLLSNPDFAGFYHPLPKLRAGARIPRPYLALARKSEADAVIEFTGAPTWAETSLLAVYQRAHKRTILFSPANQEFLFQPGWSWRCFVAPRAEAFLASPARWLVVHRRIYREIRRLDRSGVLGDYLPPPEAMEHFSRQGAAMVSELTRTWGKPDLHDGWVVVWDLERVRAARPPG